MLENQSPWWLLEEIEQLSDELWLLPKNWYSAGPVDINLNTAQYKIFVSVCLYLFWYYIEQLLHKAVKTEHV